VAGIGDPGHLGDLPEFFVAGITDASHNNSYRVARLETGPTTKRCCCSHHGARLGNRAYNGGDELLDVRFCR